MLEFFRKYQRYFFLVITVVVISSFVFFGTYSTLAGGAAVEREDRAIGQTIDGSRMMRSEVQKISRFIATDREDSVQKRGSLPNLCNDGVLRYDFLRDRLGELLVAEYFEELKGDLAARLDKAKRFRSYVHPEAPFLSAQAIWDQLLPVVNGELAALQGEKEAGPAVFAHLAKLYQYQSRLQPEMLRRILIYQHQQYPWLSVDQRLASEDLSLFGFYSAADWFGHHFVDLAAQFILNGAAAAEQKGYRVSLAEAKGELMSHFQESVQKMGEAHGGLSFHRHLQMLGFDEREAAEVWRKILLFRRYFRDVGESAFVDTLPYKDFAAYAKESVIVQNYQWPLQIQSQQDLGELQFYIKAVCPKGQRFPASFLSVEEVEKKHPELVQTTYRAMVAEVSKSQLGLKVPIKQVWQWQTADQNWTRLRQKFSLPATQTPDERFHILEKMAPKLRAELDGWSRECLVDENPSWIGEALDVAPKKEKTWSISGGQEPDLGIYCRVEGLCKVGEKHILPFSQAREVLARLVGTVEGEKGKNPFIEASQEALAALQLDPLDPRWVQSGTDPLLDSFRLQRKEQSVLRTSQENWMKEQAFSILPGLWSPVHVDDDGHISFFYLQEKRADQTPILEQLAFGKETLAADAKIYVAERLLQTIKKNSAMALPVPQEVE